jgi:hypothetical protein
MYFYNTVHKPSVMFGNGFRFAKGELSVETMKDCCKCKVPAYRKTEYTQAYGNGERWEFENWIKSHWAANLVEFS